VAARSQQEVVQRMPQRDRAEIGAVLDDPPVRGVDAAFARRDVVVGRPDQPVDPGGEARDRVYIIVGLQPGTILVNTASPFIARGKPGVPEARCG
jgi:hypothetical protein